MIRNFRTTRLLAEYALLLLVLVGVPLVCAGLGGYDEVLEDVFTIVPQTDDWQSRPSLPCGRPGRPALPFRCGAGLGRGAVSAWKVVVAPPLRADGRGTPRGDLRSRVRGGVLAVEPDAQGRRAGRGCLRGGGARLERQQPPIACPRPAAASLRLPFVALAVCAGLACLGTLYKPSPEPADTNFPGWPHTFEGQKLESETREGLEFSFSKEFPGRIGRFRAGDAVVILRWTDRATYRAHSAGACLGT